jgi:tRNA pseudouridine38-40 synthase
VGVFKLVIGYDGTAFHGWQVQPGRRTVQGVLEDALSQVIGSEVNVNGAGRTDAGVHARGQVASFEAQTRLPARALPPLLARALPPDVRVQGATEVRTGFHARHSAVARRYSYHLLAADDILWSRFAWAPPRAVRPEALECAATVLEGEHDCSAFRASGSSPGSPVCTIFRAGWSRWEAGLRFDIVADHFLYHMVRTLVGTLLAVARERDSRGGMRRVLESRDRGQAGLTAPSEGLCLEQVFYLRESVA